MENKKNLIRMANRVQDALMELKHHRYMAGLQRQNGAAVERAGCSMIYRIQYHKSSSSQKARRKRLPNCRYWLRN